MTASGPGADCAETPEQNDYDAYLAFLKDHGHNFIRLWRWEQFKSQAAGGSFHLCMTPQPWPRTGPGTASDGKPKFDLVDVRSRRTSTGSATASSPPATRASTSRSCSSTASALHLSPAPDNVEGHPFHAANNVNGISITSIVDYQVLPLDPRVQALQEAYIRKVVDTVHDLPNVLYEVANESSGGGSVDQEFAEALGLGDPPDWGDSTAVAVLGDRRRQAVRAADGVRHAPDRDDDAVPGRGPDARSTTRCSTARRTGSRPATTTRSSPTAGTRWRRVVRRPAGSTTRPPSDGSEGRHHRHRPLRPGQGRRAVGLEVVPARPPPDPHGLRDHRRRATRSTRRSGVPSYEAFEPARYAMGDTLRYAERMKLVEMEPRGDLSSTGYVLANPGEEYLVLQPSEAADPFTVTLATGTYSVEWFSINSRETEEAGKVTVESDGSTSFTAPFVPSGPAVLYLKRVE